MQDSELFSIINKENERQCNHIELIASENYVSQDVLNAVGSCVINKYAEGYPGKRYYGGCTYIDEIESLAIEKAKKLFNVSYVNVQPHSGTQANLSVLTALCPLHGKILSLSLNGGGHLTHGTPLSLSGKIFDAFHYSVNKETGYLDLDEIEKIANIVKPNLIICGASAYSRDWDYKQFRNIADKHNAILMADIAHPAGLIACHKLNSPFEYCHVVTSTTHKTLRGARGGMIMMKQDFQDPLKRKKNNGDIKMVSDVINSSVFPGNQGGPLENMIAGKAVAFYEALSTEYRNYIDNVCNNAKYLAELFIDNGYKISTNGTDNHLMLIDLSNKNITGLECEKLLDKVNITVNKNMIPNDPLSPLITSGIRIGTPAMTTKLFGKNEFTKTFEYIDSAIKYKDNESVLKQIKQDVISMLKNIN